MKKYMYDIAEGGKRKLSLVKMPAIDENFKMFNKEYLKFKIENEERRIITGPILIPDYPMFRRRKSDNYEYYAEFSKEAVENIALEFMKNNSFNDVNTSHSKDVDKEDILLFEFFIVDETRGIHTPDGWDTPDGTLFGSYKIYSDELWQDIKDGKYKGFSIEGIFEIVEEEEFKKTENLKEIKNLYNSLLELQKIFNNI